MSESVHCVKDATSPSRHQFFIKNSKVPEFFFKSQTTDVEDVLDLLDPVHDNILMSGPGDQPNSSAESDHSGQIGET